MFKLLEVFRADPEPASAPAAEAAPLNLEAALEVARDARERSKADPRILPDAERATSRERKRQLEALGLLNDEHAALAQVLAGDSDATAKRDRDEQVYQDAQAALGTKMASDEAKRKDTEDRARAETIPLQCDAIVSRYLALCQAIRDVQIDAGLVARTPYGAGATECVRDLPDRTEREALKLGQFVRIYGFPGPDVPGLRCEALRLFGADDHGLAVSFYQRRPR
jgi:hypothetical protein